MNTKKAVKQDQAREKERLLGQILSAYKSALVAFSGGVDSTYLLSRAVEVIGPEKVLAITISSNFTLPGEAEEAEVLARKLQARHGVMQIDLLSDQSICSNPPERCYNCKRYIFEKLLIAAGEHGLEVVLDGSNADDPADHRPGLRALKELDIASPLLEAGLSKEEIRELSRMAKLPTWNKPSAACLASRFPYGEELTAGKLERAALAEQYLRQAGIKQELRIRCHGDIARIEVNRSEFKLVLDHKDDLVKKLKELGFVYITLDLSGFKSGSMNNTIK